ncbi:MAG TPA: hypothetical protein PK082_05005, partial [Phycisphaerae bacterium]|nr:hypothetical protein [Phycisphaerae bacterium]
MDRRQIGLKLSLDHLGLDFKVDSFEDRLILQKAICLAQAAGVKLGYYYGWYLHGPYCPALARDAYSVKGELDAKNDESTGWSLSAESQACLEKVRP